jgi:lysyl-tRNA synthetase class 2
MVSHHARDNKPRNAKLTVVQFITNNYSIREVLPFPFLREEKTAQKEKFAAELVDVQPLPEEGIRK